jgi:hypothetical protein
LPCVAPRRVIVLYRTSRPFLIWRGRRQGGEPSPLARATYQFGFAGDFTQNQHPDPLKTKGGGGAARRREALPLGALRSSLIAGGGVNRIR